MKNSSMAEVFKALSDFNADCCQPNEAVRKIIQMMRSIPRTFANAKVLHSLLCNGLKIRSCFEGLEKELLLEGEALFAYYGDALDKIKGYDSVIRGLIAMTEVDGSCDVRRRLALAAAWRGKGESCLAKDLLIPLTSEKLDKDRTGLMAMGLGEGYKAEGNKQEALRWFEIAHKNDAVGAAPALAQVYFDLGSFRKAAELFRIALAECQGELDNILSNC